MNLIQKISFKLALVAAISFSLAPGCSPLKPLINTHSPTAKVKVENEPNPGKPKEEVLKRKQSDESVSVDAKSALKIMKENAPKVRLNEYFDAIAYADNTASANTSIKKALAMFTSTDTPVLMVISEQSGKKNYDTPTTIKAYLNYLKDQKKNLDDIKNIKIDYSGKITEVELKKNN